MKRILILLFAGLLAVSCEPANPDATKVHIDKALKRPVKSVELYAKADVIPLRVPEGFRAGQGETLLEVAADRFFLLNQEKDAILVFNFAGEFVTAIRSAEPVIDFSPYQDRALDVLTEHAITEYAIGDGSTLTRYPIQDNDVELRCATRLNENEFFVLGSKDRNAYSGGYLVNRKRFYIEPFPGGLHSIVPASDVQNTRFFHDGNDAFEFLSQSGVIFALDAPSGFAYLALVPDFGKKAIHFTNVQKSGGQFYYAFEREDASGVLVCDRKTGACKVFRKTEKEPAFPLGVIYAGCNYCCCPAARLPEFLPDAPADGGEGPVIIRYTL